MYLSKVSEYHAKAAFPVHLNLFQAYQINALQHTCNQYTVMQDTNLAYDKEKANHREWMKGILMDVCQCCICFWHGDQCT